MEVNNKKRPSSSWTPNAKRLTVRAEISPAASKTTPKDRSVTTRCSRVRASRASYSCTVDEEHDSRKEFPMFIAMADLYITPTGFKDSKKREELCSKIRLMCGEVSMAYTNRTTHILAAHANTSKVELARERKLPVVSVEWIEKIWDTCQGNHNPYIHASLPQFADHEFPVFKNLNFVFSDSYALDEKNYYTKFLKDNGGNVVMQLKSSVDHFYICQKPESANKYDFAQQKRIPCLPFSWIIESVNKKTLVKMAEYEIRGPPYSGFGVSFEVGPDSRHSLPVMGGSEPKVNLDTSAQSMYTNEFDPGAFLDEIDAFTPMSNSTLHGSEIISTEGSYVEDKMDDTGSILEQTVIEVGDDSKDAFVDSLTFSIAA